jgi:hypothetical protein
LINLDQSYYQSLFLPFIKMARRRTKKRTHVQVQNGSANSKNGAASMNRSPKSMVIRIGAGEVGSSVSQLVKDFRLMMEPDTASRLKVRILTPCRAMKFGLTFCD